MKRKDVTMFAVVSGLVLLLLSVGNTIAGFSNDLIFYKMTGVFGVIFFSITSYINIRAYRNHV
ncbi:hypothetical protein QE109_17435 [Fusibacter bizertensis]|uniref:Uncharacterized protein n=1 Tax=Fusibacter bizertensis TaxID=1488331 RepID=A0ABT6NHM9_9FIRM|nr:hypothetical protein [Fusibacter bizertensis]MDH8679934.1 hypothetical protein [Fusibacter bizertensis]